MSQLPWTQKVFHSSKYNRLFFSVLLLVLLLGLYQALFGKEDCMLTRGAIESDFYKNVSQININVRDWSESFDASECKEKIAPTCKHIKTEGYYVSAEKAEEMTNQSSALERKIFQEIKAVLELKFSRNGTCRAPAIFFVDHSGLEIKKFSSQKNEINLSVNIRRMPHVNPESRLLTINGFKIYGLNSRAEFYDQAFWVPISDDKELKRLLAISVFPGAADSITYID